MGDSLDGLRAELDDVDHQLLEVLAQRRSIVRRTARLKAEGSAPIRDALREEAIFARLERIAEERGLEVELVKAVFHEILAHSVRQQSEHLLEEQNGSVAEAPLVVGYQGVEGAYSHVAARRHFTGRARRSRFVGYPSFRAMLEAVERGEADTALLPIENTTAGSINEAYDLLANLALAIVGEEVLAVEHCLLALGPLPLESIRKIYSHPQALAQCSELLSRLAGCTAESYLDTALAARRVREEGDPTHAAIASEEAGRLYGLHVLRRDLANQGANFTRFVVVATAPVRVDLRLPAKTSLVFSTAHRHGALVDCLRVLADHDLNLTKLESRPIRNVPWEYLFYADVEGNLAEERTREALSHLAEHTAFLKILGCYPASDAVRL